MERITLKTTIASEHCTANENETIEVARLHPVPEMASVIAQSLLDGGYAVKVANATAPDEFDTETEAAGERETDDGVKGLSLEDALKALDPLDDEDWTSAGKPAMRSLEILTGNKTLTRADVDAAFPDFKRPNVDDGDGGAETDDGDGGAETDDGDGGAGVEVKRAARGPRSNRP